MGQIQSIVEVIVLFFFSIILFGVPSQHMHEQERDYRCVTQGRMVLGIEMHALN